MIPENASRAVCGCAAWIVGDEVHVEPCSDAHAERAIELCRIRGFEIVDERRECLCRGYDPADPCLHGNTSQGCPVHDPNYADA
jgi:hypothetical protein